MTFQGRPIEIRVERNSVEYKLIEGDKLTFLHRDEKIELNACADSQRRAIE